MKCFLENKTESYNKSLLGSIFSKYLKSKESLQCECTPDQALEEDCSHHQDCSKEDHQEGSCESDCEAQYQDDDLKKWVFVPPALEGLIYRFQQLCQKLKPCTKDYSLYQDFSEDDYRQEDSDEKSCQSDCHDALLSRTSWTKQIQQPSANAKSPRKNSGGTTRPPSSAMLPSQCSQPPGYPSGKGRCSLAMLVLALQLLVLPSSAQVGIFPNKVVAGLRGDVTFRCTSVSSQIERVEWLINGTSLNDGHRSDGVTQEHDIVLQFSNVSAEYNNTRIQCIADTVLSPEPATLLVQGLLSAVGSLLVAARMNHIYVNWTAPFTLDITLSPVDITYCVDVVSSTSSATLHSECGITETQFTYLLPPKSWCHEYDFIVTPVNTAGNGTNNSMLYLQDIPGPHLMDINVGSSGVSVVMILQTSCDRLLANAHFGGKNVVAQHKGSIIRNALSSSDFSLHRFCLGRVCQAEVLVEDLHTKEGYILREPDVTIAETDISFRFEFLTLNRLYLLRVTANNAGGQNMSEGKISTHDIINCTTNNNSDSISINVEFTEHSEATGALLNFIYITEDGVIDFSRSVGFTANKTGVSQGLTLPMSMWSPGQYTLYVYDIEGDKMIMNGVQYPASSVRLTAKNGQAAGSPTPTSRMNCSVDSDAEMITVACSFLFQVTAQRNTLDSVNILHVNTSMDPQTPVTLQVTENGEYLVTILPVQDGRGIISTEMLTQIIDVDDSVTTQSPITSSPIISSITGIVLGTVLGLGCLTVVVIVVVVIVTTNHKKIFKKRETVGERNNSITMHMSKSGPSTSTAAQDAEPAYAMVHDINSDVCSYSPVDVEESSVQQGSVQSETTQDRLEEVVTPSIPTYSVVKKPHKKTPPSARTEPSHPPPSWDSVVLPPCSDQETSAPVAIPGYTNVDVSQKKLTSGSAANSSQSESTFQTEDEMNSSVTPLIAKFIESLAAPAKGQSGHYVALDNPKMAVSPDVINVHHTSSEYTIPTGCKNEQNQTYAIVELKAGRDRHQVLELAKAIETVSYSEGVSQA